MKKDLINDALTYHSAGRKGKIEVIPTKPCATQYDLSLAYSPGVGAPCLEIAKDPEKVFEYTAKGNLVAVISNGTAVLGLGNLGALGGKPVMEGKGVLFKRFADIDVFDIEVNTEDPEEIIRTCQLIAPTFGGINLEDIKSPECFYIEQTLKETTDIPVFHDDQHGTAIISSAGLLNALELQEKKIDKVKVVFNGTGASGIACAKMFLSLGVNPENLIMCDSKGVIYKGRTAGMNACKEPFARDTSARTLTDAITGADVFVGCSVGGVVSKEMIALMAPRPVVFALANPDPEITYPDVISVRDDVIMATGRSDYPNQVNNVLGFPYIFRGALDVRTTAINEDMKKAAAMALAALAKEPVPIAVSRAYGGRKFAYGKDYIIPKPFDPRVLYWVAPAVAKAAMDTGVARKQLDIDEYKVSLRRLFNPSRTIVNDIMARATQKNPRLIFCQGEHDKIILAASNIVEKEFARPVLLGDPEKIIAKCKRLKVDDSQLKIVAIETHPRFEEFVETFTEMRKHRGMTLERARDYFLNRPTYFGAMMVRQGEGEGLLSGLGIAYPKAIKPALEVIGTQGGVSRVYGLYIMVKGNRVLIFADTTVNIDLDAGHLAEVAILSANLAGKLGIEPRVAMLSFSHFGDAPYAEAEKMRRATELVRRQVPDLAVVGEIHADYAVSEGLATESFPWFGGDANILIFPNLAAGNIAYKLVQQLGGFDAIGPILVGMNKPANAISRSALVNEIVNLAAVTAAEIHKEASS
ncbi:NADP-dependent malic enzyme [Planctomycetota bacterium]